MNRYKLMQTIRCKLSLLLESAEQFSGQRTFREDDVKHDIIAFTSDWNGLRLNDTGQVINIQHLQPTDTHTACKLVS